jgi:ribonuclease HIII
METAFPQRHYTRRAAVLAKLKEKEDSKELEPPQQTSFSYKLNEKEQALLRDYLEKGNYNRIYDVPYTTIAAETDDCKIMLYTSGKLLVQGKGAQDFVMFVLEPKILGRVGIGYEEMLNPENFSVHIGVDESGKGDFFGPMVIAAAYSDKELAYKMKGLGVKDSKNISSDDKAIKLAGEIRKLLGNRYAIVQIGPEAYNRLYAAMRNVNSILAWGHARAIENLLKIVPNCPKAISDQFGDEELIKKALMKKGRTVELVQRHKAEADIAVAAASVLARAAFLNGLKKIGNAFKIYFPKGASDRVVEKAVELIKNSGASTLLKTAKCHFRTLDKVLEITGYKRSDVGKEALVVSKSFVQLPRL